MFLPEHEYGTCAGHVPLDQRNGAAYRMRHTRIASTARITDKKLRIFNQDNRQPPIIKLRGVVFRSSSWAAHR